MAGDKRYRANCCEGIRIENLNNGRMPAAISREHLMPINDQPKILEDLSNSGYQFLISDLDVGLTLSRIASRSSNDDEKRIRNIQNARRAYDKVQELVPRLALDGSQARQVREKSRVLKSALEKLGEHF